MACRLKLSSTLAKGHAIKCTEMTHINNIKCRNWGIIRFRAMLDEQVRLRMRTINRLDQLIMYVIKSEVKFEAYLPFTSHDF